VAENRREQRLAVPGIDTTELQRSAAL
jgi:hypothetical protein